MLLRFNHFINQNKLFASGEKILLAISGGIDSMVMLDLFNNSDHIFEIVHCNFNLRGKESDDDELFVRNAAEQVGVKIHVKSFDTKEWADNNGISIEMAARDLRYDYFNTLISVNNFSCVATAHHNDDVIETFFLNLLRKTGIKGLSGIKPKAGNVVRPLLFVGRDEIIDYAEKKSIGYRHDSTNSSNDYKRNFLRNKIIPELEFINSAYKENILASIGHLKDAENVYLKTLEVDKQKVLKESENTYIIDIKGLLNTQFPKELLFEILNDFLFNAAVISEIYDNLNDTSGKQFYSKTYRVVKDRHALIITKIRHKKLEVFYLEEADLELFEPVHLVCNKLPNQQFKILTDPAIACLDYDRIEFPLTIRKWRQGEYFQPLGMTGFKKVSDFFIDEKLSIPEKENCWILYSGEKIVWIMGYRIDNRFKISSQTKHILKIELQ